MRSVTISIGPSRIITSSPSPACTTIHGWCARFFDFWRRRAEMKYRLRPSHAYHTGTACGRPSGRVVLTQMERKAQSQLSIMLHGINPCVRNGSIEFMPFVSFVTQWLVLLPLVSLISKLFEWLCPQDCFACPQDCFADKPKSKLQVNTIMRHSVIPLPALCRD